MRLFRHGPILAIIQSMDNPEEQMRSPPVLGPTASLAWVFGIAIPSRYPSRYSGTCMQDLSAVKELAPVCSSYVFINSQVSCRVLRDDPFLELNN